MECQVIFGSLGKVPFCPASDFFVAEAKKGETRFHRLVIPWGWNIVREDSSSGHFSGIGNGSQPVLPPGARPSPVGRDREP